MSVCLTLSPSPADAEGETQIKYVRVADNVRPFKIILLHGGFNRWLNLLCLLIRFWIKSRSKRPKLELEDTVEVAHGAVEATTEGEVRLVCSLFPSCWHRADVKTRSRRQ